MLKSILVSAKLAAEPLVLGLHGRLRVDKHQARHAVDDNLVSRLDDLRRIGDARDGTRTAHADRDAALSAADQARRHAPCPVVVIPDETI